ncbi:hypothetical protein HanIR_Chr16g0837261 [Helianthus annuus]|nr:hypothetical protein HanIR_Chr16g0837261 [Helianthus annuus]
MAGICLILVRFIKILTLTERETKKSHDTTKKIPRCVYIDQNNNNEYQFWY